MFQVSDKRWYWLKAFALATIRDWDALEKFSKEKRPPVGLGLCYMLFFSFYIYFVILVLFPPYLPLCFVHVVYSMLRTTHALHAQQRSTSKYTKTI